MNRLRLGSGRGERGAVLPLAAVAVIIAMIASALAIDIGMLAQDRRRNQKVADLAALDGVRALPNDPTTAVRNSATRNRFPWSNTGYVLTVETLDDTDLVVSPANATKVRVTAKSPRKPFFPFVGDDTRIVSAKATAAMVEKGQVEVGSKLASVSATDNLVLNRVFSRLFGVPLSTMNLSVVGYQGLAGGNVSLAELVAADPTLGSPSQLLNTPVSVRRLAQASATALSNRAAGGDTAAGNAATPLGTFAGSIDSALSARVGDMLAFDQPDGDAAASAQINAFDLITTGAQRARINNGTNVLSIPQLEINPTTGLPIVNNLVPGSTVLTMNLIEAPRQSALGPARCTAAGVCETFAKTAQIAMTLTTQIRVGSTPCPGLLCVVQLSLPIQVSAVNATANLTDIRCGSPVSASQADVRVDTNAGNVTSTATATVSLVGPVTLPLSPQPLAAGSQTKTFTGPFPTAWQSTAAQSLGLRNLIASFPLLGSVLGILNPIVDQIDGVLLQPVMRGLGISIAGADTRVNQVVCGVPQLVA